MIGPLSYWPLGWPWFTENAEGTNGTDVTTSNSAFTTIAGTAVDATLQFRTLNSFEGNASIRLMTESTVTTVPYMEYAHGSETDAFYRFFYRHPSSATYGMDTTILRGRDNAGTQAFRLGGKITGTFEVRNAANTVIGTTTTVIPDDTWLRIEVHYTAGVGVTVRLYVTDPNAAIGSYDEELVAPLGTGVGANVTTSRFGQAAVEGNKRYLLDGIKIQSGNEWIGGLPTAALQVSTSDAGTGADVSGPQDFQFSNDFEAVQVDATDLTIANSGNTATSNQFDIVQAAGTNASGRLLYKTLLGPQWGTSHLRALQGSSTPAAVYFGWGTADATGWNHTGDVYVRAYIKIQGAVPPNQQTIIKALSSTGADSYVVMTADDGFGNSNIEPWDPIGFGTISTTNLPVGSYFRLEVKFSPSTDHILYRIFLDPNGTTPDESVDSVMTNVRAVQGIVFGTDQTFANLSSLLIDEVAVSTLGWPALATPSVITKSASDSASGSETSNVAITASDSASGADSSSLSTGATPKSASDSAAGADASVSVAIATTDAGTGADVTAGRAIATSDAATAADASALVAAIPTTDAGAGTETSLAQVDLHPASVISAGAWQPSTGTDLVATVDEQVADDTDFDYTITTSTMELKMEASGDPTRSDGHEVIIRYEKEGTVTVDLSFSLVQGTTVLDTWTATNIADPVAELHHVLTATVADSITDYGDLRVRVAATVT